MIPKTAVLVHLYHVANGQIVACSQTITQEVINQRQCKLKVIVQARQDVSMAACQGQGHIILHPYLY